MQATRRGFLLGSMTALFTRFARAEATRAKHVIVLWMNGGPSHVDTWDPKKHSRFRAIPTSVRGVAISEHLPRLARVADKLAIVRGMTSREGNHQRAQYLLRTGYAPNPTVDHPSLGAWTSKRFEPPKSGLPSFVSLNGASHGGGFFGVEHGPFVVQRAGTLPEDVASAVPDARFEARRRLLEELEEGFAKKTGDPKVAGRRALYASADRLMHASALSAFDLSSEPAATLAAYGDTPFGRACATAARLVTAGVRYVEVTLDGWDTHKNGFERTRSLMGQLDPAMSALLADLEQRERLRETLVVWIGDFGRTPRINADEGRDHHPAAWSAVLAGAGIRRGIVHGETDPDGGRVVRDPVTVPDLFATLATAIGLDPNDTVATPAGRPITMTNDGTPVRALLATA